MKFPVNIVFNSNEYFPKNINENDFGRIALVNGLGALILAPFFTLILYLSNAPMVYVYLGMSYTLAFPAYYLLCLKVISIRKYLIYILIFHLTVLSFWAFNELYLSAFQIREFMYFLYFYILSLIIIQRLYPAVLYHVMIVTVMFYAYRTIPVSVMDLEILVLLFTLFGSSNLLMIYARSKMIYEMEDYSDYLKKIMNNPGTGYVLFDLKNGREVIDHNSDAKNYFTSNTTTEDFTKDFFDQFDAEEFKQISDLKLGSNFMKTLSFELQQKQADIEIRISLINLKNNFYWLAQLNDVTIQNKKRLALEISEKKYRNLYYKNKSGVFTLGLNSEIVDANEAFYQLFEGTIKIGDRLFGAMFSREWDIILETLTHDETNQNYQTQYRLTNGHERNFIFSWYLDKQSNHIEGIITDLTNIQRTAQALKQSEIKYRMIFEESNDAILLLHGDRIVDANIAALRLFTQTAGQIRTTDLFDFSWDTGVANEKLYHQQKAKLANRKNVKFNWLIKSDNEAVETEIALTEIILENKLYFQCVIHDLTEQKKLAKETLRAELAEETNLRLEAEIQERIKTEKQLQELFLKTRAILESSSNTFLLTTNLTLQINSFNSHCNSYFQQYFGKEVVLGAELMAYFQGLIPDNQLRLFKRLIHRVVKGKGQHIEVKITNEKHYEHWIEIYLSPILDTEGKVTEISLVAHDITDKKQSSIAIEESLKEKEVLLKEIHHRVKNNLQVISSILNLQSSFVQDPKTLDILQESRNRIRSMAIIHEYLYKTKHFSSIRFGEYLQNLSQNLIASYSVHGHVHLITTIEEVDLILDQAIPCGLLVNEVITNALKYAWDDQEQRNFSISLKQEDAMVILRLSDNGKGLPASFEEMNAETLGLQLILTLSEQLDGTLHVENEHGTNYLLTFENKKPLDHVKN